MSNVMSYTAVRPIMGMVLSWAGNRTERFVTIRSGGSLFHSDQTAARKNLDPDFFFGRKLEEDSLLPLMSMLEFTSHMQEPLEPCICRVTGDPILETSDGMIKSLTGPALYVLSKLASDPPSACDHNVVLSVNVTQRGVLEPAEMYITAGGDTVTFTQEGAMVSGSLVALPFEEFGIWVDYDPFWTGENDGSHLLYRLNSCPFSFAVSWDAMGVASRLVIESPGEFSGFYQGMCGDCDGDVGNDFTLG